jgi:tetratricopeptide (TPR) repeat protein
MQSATRAGLPGIQIGIGILCASIISSSTGCTRISQYLCLRQYDSAIDEATRALESAQNDAQRAAAYADRGGALGEKARYSRAFKLIPDAEHARLIEMSMKDYGQAIALAPGNAEMYYRRGHTSYMQAAFSTFDPKNDPKSKTYFEAAKADCSKTLELDPKHATAFEYRGMASEGLGDLDAAIADYTQLAALQAKSRYRLADAYCNRGYANLRIKNQVEAAIADYEKSVEIGSNADGCSCEPYNPLVGIYLNERPDVEKAREVVRRAQAARKWIAPEHLEKLK